MKYVLIIGLMAAGVLWANEGPEKNEPLFQDTGYTAVLRQLDAPLGRCHIQVLDLPEKYRLPADEKRLDNNFVSESAKELLEKKYPVLKQYLSVTRVWISDDKKTIGFLLYHNLGEFLLVSQDSGKTWSAPLYLGIHRLPESWYGILADSKLPMIVDGNVQLEVSIWKRDESKGGNPLLGYSYLWKKWHKYLSMSLADLQRDSDGDGLTDLFEERILTDPHSADTDGDGILDASDNQPLTPFPKRLTDSDNIMLALIPYSPSEISSIFPSRRADPELSECAPTKITAGPVFLSDSITTQVLTRKGVAFYTAPHSAQIPPNRTTLVFSDSDCFPHVTGDARVIVLNKTAVEKYRRKFNGCGTCLFDLRYNKARNKARLELFESNQGCTIDLWKSDGRWKGQQTSIRNAD